MIGVFGSALICFPPLLSEQPALMDQAGAREGVSTAVKRQVLIVGSEAVNRRAIEEAAIGWMLETIVCSSLQESKAHLSKQDVAVIFCQDRLKDGTYRDLLSVVSKVPVVVMITDVNQDGVHREAIELGALDVVASPCSRKDVQWMIIRAMHG